MTMLCSGWVSSRNLLWDHALPGDRVALCATSNLGGLARCSQWRGVPPRF
jgi:hypothetical protein